MNQSENSQAFLGLTAEIISAHVKNNRVDPADLPLLIEQVYLALRHAGAPSLKAMAPAQTQAATEPERQAPIVAVKQSIFPDYIVCLEDGRKMKTLKRYLRTTYNMTPEQYREKWGLPPEYPMVAPSYAEHRSALAKQTGLGRKPAASAAVPEARPVTTPAPSLVTDEKLPPVAAPQLTTPPVRESRSEHTLASVFLNFPHQSAEANDAQDAVQDAEERKPRRKPFSKQLARSMRR